MGLNPSPDPEQTEFDWPAVLKAAAAIARHGSTSETELLQNLADELLGLGLSGEVYLFDAESQLRLQRRILDPSVESRLHRLVGRSLEGYVVDPDQNPIFRTAFDHLQPEYCQHRSETLPLITPGGVRTITPRIASLIGGELPAIVAPLIQHDAPLGALAVSANWLRATDTPLVNALADHFAIALGHVRSHEEMKAALERERLRNEVVEAVASALDLQIVLDRVIRLAVEAVGADAGAIAFLESDGQSMANPFMVGLPDDIGQLPLQKGSGLAWEIMETQKPVYLRNYRLHPDALPAWVEAGIQAFLGIPLIVGGEVIGVMGLFTLSPDHDFREAPVEMAQAIARMAAIAVKNARLYAETSEQAEELRSLIQTAQAISASLDIDTVLHLIVEQAKELLRADGSRIHMRIPGEGVFRCLVAVDPQAGAFLEHELAEGEGLVGHVAAKGEAMLFNDPSKDPHSVQIPGTPKDEIECVAMAPLKTRQRTIGVMTVRRLGIDRPFTESNLKLLSAFATQAAVAIENADLYGQIEAQATRLEHEVEARTRELALSEARYRALVETSLAGIFQMDETGQLVYVNQAIADLLGRPRDEIMHQPVSTLWAPEFQPTAEQQLKARFEGKRPPREVLEVELMAKNERRVSALLAVSTIIDEQDRIQGMTGLVLDISRRKILESALRAERDRLTAILTNIADAVMVTDPDNRIEYVNPAWEQLTGYEAAEILGSDPSFLQSEQVSVAIYAEMDQTANRGNTWRGQLINRRSDGSTYDASVSLTPVLDEGHNAVNFVSVQHDITALKEVDRLKSQFVSDVSHELRTPLTNIRLYADLLTITEDRQKILEYLRSLTRESDRLTYLIDDLLSLSRLESGAMPLSSEPVDINDLLSGLVEDRRRMAQQRGLDLTLEGDPGLPRAMGDERMLTQVFTNLLTNAMNYTEQGGHITLRTTRGKRDQQAGVEAEVEDTGLGISDFEQHMIFERFFRGEASLSTGAPGTGLGLAICQEIAMRHGGEISVESKPGGGSIFQVWLPAASRNNGE